MIGVRVLTVSLVTWCCLEHASAQAIGSYGFRHMFDASLEHSTAASRVLTEAPSPRTQQLLHTTLLDRAWGAGAVHRRRLVQTSCAVAGVATGIATGGNHSCAVMSSGRVKCWGAGDTGQLGQGTARTEGIRPGDMEALPFIDLGKEASVVAVAAGTWHTCALLKTGRVKCWGASFDGQLGLGDTQVRGDQRGEMGDDLPEVDLGKGQTVVQIAAGAWHNCALLQSGAVKCWGFNSDGELGLGDTASRGDEPGEMGDALPAVDLGTSRKAVQISAGFFHSCAVLDDGSVKCWGFGGSGALGLGDSKSRGTTPGSMGDQLPAVNLGKGVKAVAVACGKSHTCALLTTGDIKCWGLGTDGPLGYEDKKIRGTTPGSMGDALPTVRLGTGRKVVALAAGLTSTGVIMDNGSVKMFGWNAYGNLGLGDNKTRGDAPGEMGDALPALDLGTKETATAIALGGNTDYNTGISYAHTCALLRGGKVKCFGSGLAGALGYDDTIWRGNSPGEMGDNLAPVELCLTPKPSPRPSPVPSPTSSAGRFPYCACRSDGSQPYRLTRTRTNKVQAGTRYCFNLETTTVRGKRCGSMDLRKLEIDIAPECQNVVKDLTFDGDVLAPSYQRYADQSAAVFKVTRKDSAKNPLGTHRSLRGRTVQLCFTLKKGDCESLSSFLKDSSRVSSAFFSPKLDCCARGVPILL